MNDHAEMDEEIDEAGRDAYLARVNSLFDEVRSWLDGTGLSSVDSSVETLEQVYGKYSAPVLVLKDKKHGWEVARFSPVGANIIGAYGRVDLIGTLAKEILIYLTDGGPVLNVKTETGYKAYSNKNTVWFKGIDTPGWYWSESPIIRKAVKFDKALFLDLLSGISDYEP